ncbi:coiled-coil domain-containing protein 63-like [Rhinoderma darwinii]|uniref:coiled-coil domain-containing protein 63-like n=1 Tax=Rhinoderma darwinii TaxID=43563 RepID=UPI003F66EB4A
MPTERKLDWHLPSIGTNEDPAPTKKDLKKLQQQCKVAEEMKMSSRKQSEHLILSQQKEITLLKEQQKELNLTIFFNGSQKNILNDKKNAKKLSELTEAQEKYNHLIQEQKNLIRDLEIKIKEKEEEIIKQKRAMCKTKTLGRSKIAQLENQLHHVTQKYNMMKTENDKQKERINHLHFKKTTYLKLFDKMQRKMNRQMASIEKIQEQVMSAHEEKNEIQAETLSLKDRADKEIKKYDTKIEELSRYVDHLNKQKQFMEAKLFDRSAKARKLRQKRQEKRLEKFKKYNQDIIDNYNTICEELGNLFGQQNVDLAKMAKQYMFNDIKNDSLFTYVNELNNEVEMVKQEIKAIEDEILHLESRNKNMLNEQLLSRKQLEEKLQKTSEAADKYKNKYWKMTKDLQQITSATEDLVKNLDCDLSAMKKMLGYEGLTSQDKLKYFKILEMKMDDLLQILNFCGFQDTAKSSLLSTSIDSLLDASDATCSVAHKKISLPSMPKMIKATDDSVVEVLRFAELRNQVLHDVICREREATIKRPRNIV